MDTVLKTLLSEWKERKLPKVIPRDIVIETIPQHGVSMATVITGFRRVGKTYLVYDAISKLLELYPKEEVIYLNFEDERIIKPETELLTDLIPQIQALFGNKPKYLFLDEIQLIPNWSKWVRRILDTEEIQLFITGSSSKMSSRELPTELRGRALVVSVPPLNFSEFVRFKGADIKFGAKLPTQGEIARFRFFLDEYLLYGGMPSVVLISQEKKLELLQTYFQTVVQRDVAERYKLENDTTLRLLLKLLLNSTEITISKISNTLKSLNVPVGKTTVANYIDYIQSSYFMNELFVFNRAIKNQMQYPRKVYFVDTGFITALSTKFSKNMGRLFENAVYNRLNLDNENLYYFRDRRGNEVDFVTLSDGEVMALYQVCYDMTELDTRKREIKALLKAGEILNCKNLNLVTVDPGVIPDLPGSIKLISAFDLFTTQS